VDQTWLVNPTIVTISLVTTARVERRVRFIPRWRPFSPFRVHPVAATIWRQAQAAMVGASGLAGVAQLPG
jgi:hypothetical protein